MPINGKRPSHNGQNDSISSLEERVALTFGSLLHDIGKVVYRGFSARGTHSKLGADFISNEIAPLNSGYDCELGRQIVEQIRYHHAQEILTASTLGNDSLAFITYFADNISAGMDRKDEGDESPAARFDKDAKLQKIFNILNGHHDKESVEHEDYNTIRERIKKNLVATEVTWNQVNSLINILEATVSAVPSSTDTTQLIDVSLFDHAKTTAGIAACIYAYLAEQGVRDYRRALFSKETSSEYYAKPMFLLYSCDMSGIQDFIYNISGSGALKQLRARSMYLEILLEHAADELLDRLGLSRANLLYTGGGHAYMLLPNTKSSKEIIDTAGSELRSWFLEHYRTDLYVASAYVECSADDLSNKGGDGKRYRSLFRHLSSLLSEAKASRYTALEIRSLNFENDPVGDHGRECRECHRSDLDIDANGRCPLCSELGKISKSLVEKDVFAIKEGVGGLVLPYGKSLHMYSKNDYLAKKPKCVRIYTKGWDSGIGLSTHIWMGDYTADVITNDERFSSYATSGATLSTSERTGEKLGVKRLGVLRADVDNLGLTFVNGLPDDKVSISRTATLSRSLSYFFKHEINVILRKGDYQVQIIYSGGDDLFIIGNWSDIIKAAIDIHDEFAAFVGNGTLTISAGVGMFDEKYPIARMAAETGELENEAKLHISSETGSAKNAIALWTKQTVYSWDEFIDCIVPRTSEIQRIFDHNEKGRAFIYRLLELLRRTDETISVPRLAYLLARSFEDAPDGDEISKEIYGWALDRHERKYLETAVEWYIYSTRERS